MTSFVYTEMEKLNPRTVLHERETTSSGRPKPILASEDEFFKYTQTRSGDVSRYNKTPIEHYNYWWKNNVKFENGRRITPLIEFEQKMGVGFTIPTYHYHWCESGSRGSRSGSYGCQEKIFNEHDWRIFQQTHTIDYGNLQTSYKSDVPKSIGQGGYDWGTYFTEKAEKQDLIVVNMSDLVFKEKYPAVVVKIPTPARPNPKEQSIASVKIEKPEPIEIEPIKEVAKYSPLMIAGILVVIVLFLKRRA